MTAIFCLCLECQGSNKIRELVEVRKPIFPKHKWDLDQICECHFYNLTVWKYSRLPILLNWLSLFQCQWQSYRHTNAGAKNIFTWLYVVKMAMSKSKLWKNGFSNRDFWRDFGVTPVSRWVGWRILAGLTFPWFYFPFCYFSLFLAHFPALPHQKLFKIPEQKPNEKGKEPTRTNTEHIVISSRLCRRCGRRYK